MRKGSEEKKILGSYPKLAKLVREITGDVPSRVAARRAKISHDTIIRMWDGDRPTESTLIRFAQGYDIEPNVLLEAAGFPLLSERLNQIQDSSYGKDSTEGDEDEDDEALLEYIKDPDIAEMVKYYRRVPPEFRPLVKENVRNAGDIVREMQEGRTIGKRSDRDDNPARQPDENRDRSEPDGT